MHRLWEAIEEDPKLEIVVDVEHKRVAAPAIGLDVPFELDDFTQYRLLNGLDDIGLTLRHADDIDAYEHARPALEADDHFTAVAATGPPTAPVERQRRCDEQEVVLAVGRAVGGELVEMPVLALREPHVAAGGSCARAGTRAVLARIDLERDRVGRDRGDVVVVQPFDRHRRQARRVARVALPCRPPAGSACARCARARRRRSHGDARRRRAAASRSSAPMAYCRRSASTPWSARDVEQHAAGRDGAEVLDAEFDAPRSTTDVSAMSL